MEYIHNLLPKDWFFWIENVKQGNTFSLGGAEVYYIKGEMTDEGKYTCIDLVTGRIVDLDPLTAVEPADLVFMRREKYLLLLAQQEIALPRE